MNHQTGFEPSIRFRSSGLDGPAESHFL